MECQIVDAACLSKEHQKRWSNIVQQIPSLDAPSFYPEFICTLAKYIPHCKIGLLSDKANVFGYLAFSEVPGTKIARAIPMCDYEPIIVEPGRRLEVREILRAMEYRSWQFQSLPSGQISLATATCVSASCSPRALLLNGFDDYRATLAATGKSSKKFRTAIRLLERDHGTVSLMHDVADEDVLRRLLQLKAQQYTAEGEFPPFVHAILAEFLKNKTGRLSGKLSLLRAGNHEVASVFCLKAQGLLYYWFPAYDQTFHKYSPGLLLIWLLMENLPALECDRMDFGPGGEPYKEYFSNANLTVYSGNVHANPFLAAGHRTYDLLERKIRSSALVQNYVKPFLRRPRGNH